MEKAKILQLVFLVFLMLLRPTVFGNPVLPLAPYVNRPLCQSQFMLVNHACATIPFNSIPAPSHPDDVPGIAPPSPEAPDSEDDSDVATHGHRHHRRHQEHAHALSPIEQECCRWLNAVDDECICDILVHLPPFLSRPVHEYIVQPYESCRVSFSCASRLHI